MKKVTLLFLIFKLIALSHANCSTFIKNAVKNTNGIYSLETIKLGGVSQTILITGKDRTKPILLFVHGGPGFSEIALVRKYNVNLDKYFVVVNWDQRGTNLSYSSSIPRSSMTMDQIIADGHELVGLLKKRFNRKKIFLLGHSWGTAVATIMASRYPQDFHAYIGVGQVAGMQDNERVSTKFALQMALKENNQKAINELNNILPYPAPANTLPQLYTSRKWMQYYGGEVYGQHDAGTIFKGVGNGKNPLYDTTKVNIGTTFSMESLWAPFLQIDLPRMVPELKLPVYFILGRHDYNVPYMLAQDYLKKLKAPSKKLFMFEKSAHLLCFEESQKFVEVMAGISSTANPGN